MKKFLKIFKCSQNTEQKSVWAVSTAITELSLSPSLILEKVCVSSNYAYVHLSIICVFIIFIGLTTVLVSKCIKDCTHCRCVHFLCTNSYIYTQGIPTSYNISAYEYIVRTYVYIDKQSTFWNIWTSYSLSIWPNWCAGGVIVVRRYSVTLVIWHWHCWVNYDWDSNYYGVPIVIKTVAAAFHVDRFLYRDSWNQSVLHDVVNLNFMTHVVPKNNI